MEEMEEVEKSARDVEDIITKSGTRLVLILYYCYFSLTILSCPFTVLISASNFSCLLFNYSSIINS